MPKKGGFMSSSIKHDEVKINELHEGLDKNVEGDGLVDHHESSHILKHYHEHMAKPLSDRIGQLEKALADSHQLLHEAETDLVSEQSQNSADEPVFPEFQQHSLLKVHHDVKNPIVFINWETVAKIAIRKYHDNHCNDDFIQYEGRDRGGEEYARLDNGLYYEKFGEVLKSVIEPIKESI